ncbi:putative phytosulfokines 6 [Vicia villosa]|uniref:putative phytosulfokines 6 n=1 Tax=Vicia villosa TaxID=3911 RepID=UPI00273ABB4F|nr:putative phytosulfokines 6 [Vicia villosa]XP_058771216.1 putative phytosulfokines 6 [Vicia villosa]
MKHQILLFFFVLILSSFFASARFLVPPNGSKHGEKELKVIGITSSEMTEDMEELMGLEECFEKDEECSSRRMIAEAHLDYIYTQHHKP